MIGKRLARVLGASSLIAIVLSAVLALWTARAETYAHYRPECTQIDLLPILGKEKLTEDEYAILFGQTGLARAGIDELWAEGRQKELLYLQQRYFAEPEIECLHYDLFIRSERLVKDKGVDFPTIQPGDILITYSGHVFGWRSGHAAIVIDAERQLTLEAITMGCDSRFCSLADWEEYPSVALLRLKDASPQERQQIAAYAKEHLQGLPYSLTAFAIFDDGTKKPSCPTAAIFSGALGQAVGCAVSTETNGTKEQKTSSGMLHDILARAGICGMHQEAVREDDAPEKAPPLTGTQCAHLVWYAYRYFGYDLDSDGGFVVTPDDLYHSDLLELVQIYGIPPNY